MTAPAPPDPTFTALDALTVTTAMRQVLGLAPERFSAEAFIGMISDEIEQFRNRGQDDTTIAAVVSKLTGQRITAELIARCYAGPDARNRHEPD